MLGTSPSTAFTGMACSAAIGDAITGRVLCGSLRGRAKRWPVFSPNPLWPCREAQGVGRAWAAQQDHASCSGSLRLFERSAASAQRVPQRRPMPEHRRLPAAKRRDTASGVAFSLPTFFWRSKRKWVRRRAHIPACEASKATTFSIAACARHTWEKRQFHSKNSRSNPGCCRARSAGIQTTHLSPTQESGPSACTAEGLHKT